MMVLNRHTIRNRLKLVMRCLCCFNTNHTITIGLILLCMTFICVFISIVLDPQTIGRIDYILLSLSSHDFQNNKTKSIHIDEYYQSIQREINDDDGSCFSSLMDSRLIRELGKKFKNLVNVNIFDRYKYLRCHVRIEQLFAPSVIWWTRIRLVKISWYHNHGDCDFTCNPLVTLSSSQQYAKINEMNSFLYDKWLHINQERDEEMIGILSTHPRENVTSNETFFYPCNSQDCVNNVTMSNLTEAPPTNIIPIMEIHNLHLNWHSILYPVIDIHASGVRINIVLGYNHNMNININNDSGDNQGNKNINGILLDVFRKMPMIWIGTATLDEMSKLLPPPPKVEGTYPRLGVLNFTNVTLLIHNKHDTNRDQILQSNLYSKSDNALEVAIPDEFFLPLFHLTNDAGPGGIDRMYMPALIKKSVLLTLRRHLLAEHKIRQSLQKSSEFLQTITDQIKQKLNESGEIFDRLLNNLFFNLKMTFSSFEEDLKNPVVKLFNDLKRGWDDISNTDEFERFLKSNIDNQLELHWKNIQKESVKGWENIRKSFIEGLSAFVKYFQSKSRPIKKDKIEIATYEEKINLPHDEI